MPKFRWFLIAALTWSWLSWSASAAESARDEDKKGLFSTFFLSGEKLSWILVMRPDRTYELTGPDGRKVSGKYTASDKELGFKSGTVQRHFSYKYEGSNVSLSSSKKDTPKAGDLLGELPPLQNGTKALFVSIQNWKKMGLPTTHAAAAEKTPNPGAAPAPANPKAPAEAMGEFSYTDPEGHAHALRLAPDGTFEYRGPGTRKATGTYLFINGALTLDSGFHRRLLALTTVDAGIQLQRRDTDILKLEDPLGEMPPQEHNPITWTKPSSKVSEQPATPSAAPTTSKTPTTTAAPVAKPDPQPPTPLPPATEAKSASPTTSSPTPPTPPTPKAEETAKPKPVPQETVPIVPSAPAPKPNAPPAEATALPPTPAPSPAPVSKAEVTAVPSPTPPASPPSPPTPAPSAQPAPNQQTQTSPPPAPETPPPPKKTSLADLAGSYCYVPNPLVTESWVLQGDGSFEYRNSSEARVPGKARLEGEVLTLQAAEVTRQFTVTIENNGALTLTRTDDDQPNLTNDLATMSPLVRKTARYERKK